MERKQDLEESPYSLYYYNPPSPPPSSSVPNPPTLGIKVLIPCGPHVGKITFLKKTSGVHHSQPLRAGIYEKYATGFYSSNPSYNKIFDEFEKRSSKKITRLESYLDFSEYTLALTISLTLIESSDIEIMKDIATKHNSEIMTPESISKQFEAVSHHRVYWFSLPSKGGFKRIKKGTALSHNSEDKGKIFLQPVSGGKEPLGNPSWQGMITLSELIYPGIGISDGVTLQKIDREDIYFPWLDVFFHDEKKARTFEGLFELFSWE